MPRMKLDFTPLDMTSLGSATPAWNAYAKAREPVTEEIKKLNAKLEPQRTALETAITNQLMADGVISAGQSLKFGYNFGRIAVAVVDAPAKGPGSKALRLGSALAPKTKR